MKKIITCFIAGMLIVPLTSSAKPPITCPLNLEYICVSDTSCPKTRCTLVSRAASPWIFLAPYKPLDPSKEDRTSCSILPEGKYEALYMASIDGHSEGAGDIAYCLYGSFNNMVLAFSALYTPEYKKGKGDWKRADPRYTTQICAGASDCEFVPR